MGSDIDAWIEYDEHGAEPFVDPPEVLPLDRWLDFRCAKDYRVFAALSGVRNISGIAPLFALRGVPVNPSWMVADYLGEDDSMTGWLYPSEVRLALEHHHVGDHEFSLEMSCVLNMLDFFVAKIGDERVRLVFKIE